MFNVLGSEVLRLLLIITAASICTPRLESAQAQDRRFQPNKVTVQADVPYTDGFVLDIYVPDGAGPFPTAVTLHGVTGGKVAMEPIARPLAEQGWLVYNANWLVTERPIKASTLEQSFEAAGCVLRFAAATSSDYGGDGKSLTVIGLSAGGLSGSLVSLGSSEFGKACKTAQQDPTVDLFIGLEGAYLNAAEGTGGLAGIIQERPDLAARLDPRTYLDRASGLRVVLFLGDQFQPPVAGTEIFYEALKSAGIPVEVRHTQGPHLATTFTEEVLELLQKKN